MQSNFFMGTSSYPLGTDNHRESRLRASFGSSSMDTEILREVYTERSECAQDDRT